jgi:hypothetical protein
MPSLPKTTPDAPGPLDRFTRRADGLMEVMLEDLEDGPHPIDVLIEVSSLSDFCIVRRVI